MAVCKRLFQTCLIGLLMSASCLGGMDIGASRYKSSEQLTDLEDILATPEPQGREDPKEFYLLDHCHMTVFSYFYDDNHNDYIYVNSSIHLKLDHKPSQGKHLQFKCYATIVSANPNYRLLLNFNKVDINSRYHIYLHERLHIFDGEKEKKALTSELGLFGNYSNELGAPREMSLPAFASDGPSLFLYFQGIPTFSSFDAIVTVFKNSTNGSCGDHSKFFYCNVSKLCIPAHLRCDGYMNCGGRDRSDEHQCYRMSDDLNYTQQQYLDSENIGIMIGSVVSLLILAIVCVWFAIMCIKRVIMKRDLSRLLHSMAANNPPVAPDPNRIYMPPHAAMAMLSPPPCYSEANPSRRPGLELPPPYWAENAHHPTDTDRLIPGSLLPPPAGQQGEDQVDSSGGTAQVFSPQSELPQYSSHDDLPTYAAATAGPNTDNVRNENIMNGANEEIMTHLQQQDQHMYSEIKEDADTGLSQTVEEAAVQV